MPKFFCDACQCAISSRESRFTCGACEFDLCQRCMFKEKAKHAHPLSEVKAKAEAKVFFAHESGNVLLSNVHLALHKKKLAKLGVSAVLTLMSPDHELLTDLYAPLPHTRNAVRDGVAFHLVDIMDVADPTVLDDPFAVLCESYAFIEEALARNKTVLIHCEMGQRRSPTCVLAWLCAKHGLTVEAAIDKVAQQYDGWKDKYLKSRADWIAVIRQFCARRDPLVRKWKAEHAADIKLWFPLDNGGGGDDDDDAPAKAQEKRQKTKA
jgi:protein-tyrosine phosphatase